MAKKIESQGEGREVMSVKDLAKFLGRSAVWVYQHKDQIPHRKIGHGYLFSRAAVLEWLASDREVDPIMDIAAEAKKRSQAMLVAC